MFKYSIIGQWSHGECTLAAVGATNVGSIVTCLEPDFQTNVSGHYWQYIRSKTSRVKSYQPPVLSTRGDEMAQFQLGSTVVLVFEAPAEFEFQIPVSSRIQMGQVLGRIPEGTLR